MLGAGANQIGSGIAVWVISLGLTTYVGRAFVGKQVTPLRPLAEPNTGTIISALFGQITATMPLAIFVVAVATWWLARTRAGLVRRQDKWDV